jgi:serine/threonine protein kinase
MTKLITAASKPSVVRNRLSSDDKDDNSCWDGLQNSGEISLENIEKLNIEDITTVLTEVPEDSIDCHLRKIGFRIGEKKLGSGSFGDVKTATRISDGETCAVKIVQIAQDPEKRAKRLRDLKNEITTLERLSGNEFVIRLFGHIIINDKMYIFMEYADGRTLHSIYKAYRAKSMPIDETKVKLWFYEVCVAVNYMHSKGFAHRDIKLENILLRKPRNVDGTLVVGGHRICKLSDFGLSRLCYSRKGGVTMSSSFGGTIRYMAPEILRLHPSAKKAMPIPDDYSFDPFVSDLWALGVLLYTLVTYGNPYDVNRNDPVPALRTMYESSYRYPKAVIHVLSQDVKDLIRQLLEPISEKRITFRGILCHPWLREFCNNEESVATYITNPVRLKRIHKPVTAKTEVKETSKPIVINEKAKKPNELKNKEIPKSARKKFIN